MSLTGNTTNTGGDISLIVQASGHDGDPSQAYVHLTQYLFTRHGYPLQTSTNLTGDADHGAEITGDGCTTPGILFSYYTIAI